VTIILVALLGCAVGWLACTVIVSRESVCPYDYAYWVTFNDEVCGHAVGDVSMKTLDYMGDDVRTLARYVCDGHGLTFTETPWHEGVVGLFYSGEDLVAVMKERD
jgi:hypothetical protein